jgi:HlyD family secretion protein
MDATFLPAGRFLSTQPAFTPPPEAPQPAAQPAQPESPQEPSRGKTIVVVGLLVAAGIIAWTQRDRLLNPAPAATAASIPTAKAAIGDFERVLRTSGTVTAQNFAAIRTPTMRAGGDRGGRQSSAMTLTSLASPGAVVREGEIVAEFEFQSMVDHLDDTRSNLTQAEADLQKKRAEIMIAQEAKQQSLRDAKAIRDKAQLDLRTADVRSEIEAEILKLAAGEAEAGYQQMLKEVELQKLSYDLELRSQEIEVSKDRLHVQRHERDLDRVRLTTPVSGLVVLESIFRGGGQFDQIKTGDEVNPGTFFMRVVDLSGMIVQGSVNQVDSQAVRIGQQAEVRLDAYPDLVLPGRVVSIGAMATTGSGGGRWSRGGRDDYVKNVGIEIAIDAADPRVIPDLSASAQIVLERKEDLLLIPRSAIRQRADKTFVSVRQGNRFAEREVEIGDVSATQAAVLTGLQPGEEVALEEVPRA